MIEKLDRHNSIADKINELVNAVNKLEELELDTLEQRLCDKLYKVMEEQHRVRRMLDKLEQQLGKAKAPVSSDDPDYQAYCEAHDYTRKNNDNLY